MSHKIASTEKTRTALVGILDLQVVLAKEGDSWIAQAIEFDYAAGGTSKEDVKLRFEEGLCATIQEQFTIYGHLENLLSSRPPVEMWVDLIKEKTLEAELYNQFSVHRFVPPSYFPFGEIRYFVPKGGQSDMEV